MDGWTDTKDCSHPLGGQTATKRDERERVAAAVGSCREQIPGFGQCQVAALCCALLLIGNGRNGGDGEGEGGGACQSWGIRVELKLGPRIA